MIAYLRPLPPAQNTGKLRGQPEFLKNQESECIFVFLTEVSPKTQSSQLM